MRLAVLLGLTLSLAYAADWNHDQEDLTSGPSTWGGSCQTGRTQSPIDIVTDDLRTKTAEPIKFMNYNATPTAMSLSNNGHSINVGFTYDSDSDIPQISGGDLGSTYRLAQFHFHWGNNNSEDFGSEHTINGKGYIMEVHFVHYKADLPNIDAAFDGATPNSNLAVIGAFFKLSDEDNEDLDLLLDGLADLDGNKGGEESITPFALEQYLPEKRNSFYRYDGGLTTPGCDEIVLWTVLTDMIPISRSQMAKFQALTVDGTKSLGNNYRPTSPVYDREVFKVVTDSDCCPMKRNNGDVYELIDSDSEKTDVYDCNSPCIYKMGNKKYCFMDDPNGKPSMCMA